MADPQTNRIVIDLAGARFSIDLLDVLEQKTKGNLSDEDSKLIKKGAGTLTVRTVGWRMRMRKKKC